VGKEPFQFRYFERGRRILSWRDSRLLQSAAEKSPSKFDIRHRLSIAAIYDVPLFREAPNMFVRTLLGGWQLGTIITEQTGFAAALAGVNDTTGTGVDSRPDVGPGQAAMLPRSNRTRER
jgi:hypothetical protein